MAGRVQTDELVEEFTARFVAAEGVNRYRRIQPLGFFIEGIKLRAAEILPVRLRRQHPAAKTELGDGAVELLRAFLGIVDRQIRDSLQSRRRLAVIGDEVVVRTAERRVQLWVTHTADSQPAGGKQNRRIDLLLVHGGQTLLNVGARMA